MLAALILLSLTACMGGQVRGNTSNNPPGSNNADSSDQEQNSDTKDQNGKGDAPMRERNPEVTIEMSDGGKIIIELFPDDAPNTVANFISVVQSGMLDGTIFHRVSPTFMIQGGMADKSLGYTIKGEFAENDFVNGLLHTRGTISMARTGDPNSATTQFFIMVVDYPSLDGKYAAFGRVIEGMDAVDKIAKAKHISTGIDGTGQPAVDQIMERVTVDTFGEEYPEPVKVK